MGRVVEVDREGDNPAPARDGGLARYFPAIRLMRLNVSKHRPSSCFVSVIISSTTWFLNRILAGSGIQGKKGTRLG